ncbi:MAG: glycosyltransferase family 39 protein [Bacteroidota bacterium]
MRNKFISLSNWFVGNQRIICIVFISFAVIRFLHLNYMNWEYGELCTGKGGIQYGYDAYRYIDGAEKLLTKESLHETDRLYIGYILIIASVFKLHLGLEYVLIIQLLFAFLAAYAIFSFCKSITGNRTAGIFASGFLLINPFVVQWHLFIHTESVYSSLLIISAWLIYKSYASGTVKYILPACFSAIFTLLIRPNGWLLIPVVLVFILIFTNLNWKLKTGISLFPVILFFLVFDTSFFNKAEKVYKIAGLNKQGVIIWEHPEIRHNKYVPDEYVKKNNFRNITYGLHKAYYSSSLVLKRIAAELLPVYRPWLSLKFILRFLLWMLPAYFFTVAGLFFLFKNKGFAFALIILSSHLLFIGITYADQEFRYLVYILPVFILLGTSGLYAVWKKLYDLFSYQNNAV